jgi:hypothetical protein
MSSIARALRGLRREMAQVLDRHRLRFCGMIELICTKAFGT